jgi:hypothetical protein
LWWRTDQQEQNFSKEERQKPRCGYPKSICMRLLSQTSLADILFVCPGNFTSYRIGSARTLAAEPVINLSLRKLV